MLVLSHPYLLVTLLFLLCPFCCIPVYLSALLNLVKGVKLLAWLVHVHVSHPYDISSGSRGAEFTGPEQPLNRVLGLTLLTLRILSWSESAFFLSVCRGSGGSHWPRYGISNQHSSYSLQSTCLILLTFTLSTLIPFVYLFDCLKRG